jgi:hypothetical protein
MFERRPFVADNPTDRDAARNRAQKHFAASEQRDVLVKQMIESERVAVQAKTAKLKALRLAKEEADRLAAPPASEKPAKKPRAKKIRPIKV